MKFNIYIIFSTLFLLLSCDQSTINQSKKIDILFEKKYKNSGFSLVYNDQLKIKKIELDKDIPIKFLNVSARKIHSKKKIRSFKKYIKNYSELKIDNENQKIAIITPDKDIIPNAQTLSPAYIVFENYEIILKWNRSLRFALAVCTLKDKFKNEI